MIKKLVLLSTVYTLIAVILVINSQHQNFIPILLGVSILYFVLMTWGVLKIVNSNVNPITTEVKYQDREIAKSSSLNKISTTPFVLNIWLGKKPIQEAAFYFDNFNFYVITKDEKKAIYSFHEIFEVSKTLLKINNRRIWQVKVRKNEEEVIFRFTHNWSIWNYNFPTFLKKITEINPKALKSKWGFWSI
ncbi:hypothetical protein [Nonlabens antarcticus]|uniref:hypothetical protein n=1 Tax=Nonlabens antarcticus TaxID=392714 RepID=UPI0018918D36|nr:hypothetical protein [Nonlabens antarcticus]